MTAYVTGGASGIGRAAAERFAENGVPTVVFDVNQESLDQVVSAIRARGGRSTGIVLDVADAESILGAFARAEADIGPARVLVNAAGVGAKGAALDLPLADWHRVMNINVTGSYLCGRAAARQMIAAKTGGRIINFTSSLALRAGAGRVAYGASKAAVIGLTQHLAVEWAKYGITVNAIAPGWTETPMTGRLSDSLKVAYLERTPATRLGATRDIIAALDYIASDAAEYLNGHVLVVDGGFTVYGLPEL
jgi:NAD(P)-dependent dehydrogenase (short-subunit alcohol dehydrogenase family)